MHIRAVIFDLDGVMFDSEILHKIAWEKVFAQQGIFLDDTVYAMGIGVSDKDFLKGLVKKNLIPDRIDCFLDEKRRSLFEISDQAKPFDGIEKLLKELSLKYKLAVASNSDKNFVMKLIENAGFIKFFNVIMGFQDISKPKPDPEIYLKCAERLGIPASGCIVIEDSPAGIKAAKSAGMRCIAITSMLDESALSEADFIIKKSEFNEVKKILESL